MKESILFGSKGNFAIELGFSKNPQKFYLQFWLQNLQMGNFKKADTLEMSIDAYKKILQKKENMYLPIFDDMIKEDIYKTTLLWDENEDRDEYFARTKIFDEINIFPFFGVQFMNQVSFHIVLYKDYILRFVWRNDFGKPINEASIKFTDFCAIFEEYKKYCEENKLI